jgi:hypothetical protein
VYNVGSTWCVEVWPVRLLFNTRMLFGLLLPMLCLWSDRGCYGPNGSVLRGRLLRKLLFVLPPCLSDTVHRRALGSNFLGIALSSFGNDLPLPYAICNPEKTQDTWRRLRGLHGCLVLFLLCPYPGSKLPTSLPL